MNLQPVPLDKAYRLLNHGPTVILSAAHGGRENAMSASWVGLFDFDPAKITAIIDRAAYTRRLFEESGYLGVQVPFAAQVAQVVALGSTTGRDNPHKLADCGVETFYPEGHNIPLIKDFHVRYMAANKIVRRWVEQVRLLNPAMLAPQHGAIYKDENVGNFLNWLGNLQCGIDLIDTLF